MPDTVVCLKYFIFLFMKARLGPRILVVDDSFTYRTEFSALLRSVGCHPAVVSSAAQAITVLDSVNPDLVITDLRLPKVNGSELARVIRSRRGFEKIPIVVISASSVDPKSILQLGDVVAFWRKDEISPESIEQLLATACGRRHNMDHGSKE